MLDALYADVPAMADLISCDTFSGEHYFNESEKRPLSTSDDMDISLDYGMDLLMDSPLLTDEENNTRSIVTQVYRRLSPQNAANDSQIVSRTRNKQIGAMPQDSAAKWRRRMRRRASIFDRVLKRDIRREYMTMLRNCINSADLSLMQHFFNTFCLPSVSMSSRMRTSTTAYKQLSGAETIAHKIVEGVSQLPDFVMIVQSVEIRQNVLYRGSKIVAHNVFKGMKIMDADLAAKATSPLSHDQLYSRNMLTKPSVMVDVHLATVMTLTLDEAHRIVSFEMVEDIVDLDSHGKVC
eukprot:gene30986-37449_t